MSLKKNIAYISGPMTGKPNHNFELFNAVSEELRKAGFFVINPAETGGGEKGLTWHQFMRIDIGYVLASDVIIMLPGWMESEGAISEFIVARAVGIPIFVWNEKDVGEVSVTIEDNINKHWTW